MHRSVLFLDLDRTLFNTPKFMHDMWTAIAAAYHINYDHEMSRVPHWYRAVGDYRYYDLKLHLEEALGKDADGVIGVVMPMLQKEDFLYDDAKGLNEWQKRTDYETRILTFGPPWVQNIKLRLTPALQVLPCDMILEAKSDFIARGYAGRRGLLVDDKRNPNLPSGFKEVWLNRDDPAQNAQGGDIITINSLAQLGEIL